jgi:hypothetical protein
MVIGGVHSAGLFSFEMGLTVTAFFYSGLVFAAIAICSKETLIKSSLFTGSIR